MTGSYVLVWLSLLARYAHVIAVISWIGASFYFVWLDDSLRRPEKQADRDQGMSGDLWAVHGGGFYHNQKYLTGPHGEPLTDDLHWFKWEAYSTWLTGIALLAVVYWAGASSFLIDKTVLDITPLEGVAISVGSLAAGWIVYDLLCRVFGARPPVLWSAVAAFLLFADWGLFHVFGARAAAIQFGAVIGTIMVANVFFVIIPGQKRMLAQIRAGVEVDPTPGRHGKMRSVHNTYLTLPALFAMLSAHYPILFQNAQGWLTLAAVGAAGVLVRRFFVLSHKGRLEWGLAAAAGFVVVVTAYANLHASESRLVTVHVTAPPPSYAVVAPIVAQRCAVCHAAHPTQPGFSAPPVGVLLDTPANIKLNAAQIRAVAVSSKAMPLGNLTGMTDAERATLGAWINAGANVP